MEVERVPLDAFKRAYSALIELSSAALGGSIVAVSDEFFAEAHHLLLVEPAVKLTGQFGPNGALYSGWETRRHNPAYDWCIIKLGTTGSISGFDIDTTHFNGNEAPEVSVDALYSSGEAPGESDPSWSEVLPKTPLGPSSRHLLKIPLTKGVNYVKLNMYPDGGIARFRAYGLVAPVFPPLDTPFDLAHAFSGGRVVAVSDQHFGVGSNLILPGRGKDMGDGWETKRSRQQGHKDWVIIKLGAPGHLATAEIDTAHFKGNFPESCEIHATASDVIMPLPEDCWVRVLPRTKLGPHRQHFFQLENIANAAYKHVRVTIHPDGGIKRVRIIGTRADLGDEPSGAAAAPPENNTASDPGAANGADRPRGPAIPALPLTPEAFSPFGRVVQGYADVTAVPAPRTTRITGANQGTAVKFHKLALLEASYPAAAAASAALSVYRCKPIDITPGGEWAVKLLERHPCTNQAFIPMGAGSGGESLQDPATRYLVIVALNGQDDKPDLSSLRAFIATAGQGIVYNTGIWHHPMAVLDKPLDLTCVETQIGNGDPLDCEIAELDGSLGYYRVQVPQG